MILSSLFSIVVFSLKQISWILPQSSLEPCTSTEIKEFKLSVHLSLSVIVSTKLQTLHWTSRMTNISHNVIKTFYGLCNPASKPKTARGFSLAGLLDGKLPSSKGKRYLHHCHASSFNRSPQLTAPVCPALRRNRPSELSSQASSSEPEIDKCRKQPTACPRYECCTSVTGP